MLQIFYFSECIIFTSKSAPSFHSASLHFAPDPPFYIEMTLESFAPPAEIFVRCEHAFNKTQSILGSFHLNPTKHTDKRKHILK